MINRSISFLHVFTKQTVVSPGDLVACALSVGARTEQRVRHGAAYGARHAAVRGFDAPPCAPLWSLLLRTHAAASRRPCGLCVDAGGAALVEQLLVRVRCLQDAWGKVKRLLLMTWRCGIPKAETPCPSRALVDRKAWQIV